jgi:inosine-uridine nucleoside N-ribohydrolase
MPVIRVLSIPLLVALLIAPVAAQEPSAVIVDTDLLTDCDDAGALAMLHALADDGEVRILGMVLDGQDTHGRHGAVASAINRWYGRGGLPIGVDKRPAGATPRKASSYSEAVAAEFPNDGLLDEQRPDAVAVYRRLLAAAPDHGVTIAAIGFLTNLDSLLRSPGDADDPRDGVALVRAKVRLLSVMGGRYPAGSEHNFAYAGAVEATRAVLERWPDAQAPMVFAGYELGAPVITGTAYRAAPPSPMRRCYELAYRSLEKGRPSWDQTAVLHAVRGLGHDGVTYWTEVAGGSNQVDDRGANAWQAAPPRRQSYLVRALDAPALAGVIESLMTRAPRPAPAP